MPCSCLLEQVQTGLRWERLGQTTFWLGSFRHSPATVFFPCGTSFRRGVFTTYLDVDPASPLLLSDLSGMAVSRPLPSYGGALLKYARRFLLLCWERDKRVSTVQCRTHLVPQHSTKRYVLERQVPGSGTGVRSEYRRRMELCLTLLNLRFHDQSPRNTMCLVRLEYYIKSDAIPAGVL